MLRLFLSLFALPFICVISRPAQAQNFDTISATIGNQVDMNVAGHFVGGDQGGGDDDTPSDLQIVKDFLASRVLTCHFVTDKNDLSLVQLKPHGKHAFRFFIHDKENDRLFINVDEIELKSFNGRQLGEKGSKSQILLTGKTDEPYSGKGFLRLNLALDIDGHSGTLHAIQLIRKALFKPDHWEINVLASTAKKGSCPLQ